MATRPLRIAVLAHKGFVRARTGIGVYARMVAELAPGAAPDVHFLLCHHAGADDLPPPGAFPGSWELVHLPLGHGAMHAAWALGLAPRLEVFTGPVDLVHQVSPSGPVRTAAPWVLTMHDAAPVRLPAEYRAHARWLYRRAVAQAMRARGPHLANSATTVAEVARHHPRLAPRLRVVPLAVPPGAAPVAPPPARRPPPRYVVAIGNPTARKNLPRLVRAHAAVRRRHADFPPLVLVGKPPPPESDLAAALARHRDGCIATGYLDAGEAAWVLDHALALAMPSLYEGFGFPVVDAFRRDLPVLAGACDALVETAGDAALLVDPTDETAIAGALERIVLDAPLRATLVERGRARLPLYAPERFAAATVAVYREAAAIRAPG